MDVERRYCETALQINAVLPILNPEIMTVCMSYMSWEFRFTQLSDKNISIQDEGKLVVHKGGEAESLAFAQVKLTPGLLVEWKIKFGESSFSASPLSWANFAAGVADDGKSIRQSKCRCEFSGHWSLGPIIRSSGEDSKRRPTWIRTSTDDELCFTFDCDAKVINLALLRKDGSRETLNVAQFTPQSKAIFPYVSIARNMWSQPKEAFARLTSSVHTINARKFHEKQFKLFTAGHYTLRLGHDVQSQLNLILNCDLETEELYRDDDRVVKIFTRPSFVTWTLCSGKDDVNNTETWFLSLSHQITFEDIFTLMKAKSVNRAHFLSHVTTEAWKKHYALMKVEGKGQTRFVQITKEGEKSSEALRFELNVLQSLDNGNVLRLTKPHGKKK